MLDHARLLGLRCLPRLIAGTELVALEEWLLGPDRGSPPVRSIRRGGDHRALPPPEEWLSLALLAGLALGIVRLALDRAWAGDASRKAVSGGVIISALLVAGAFMVNNNIFDSDNYRYLIYFLSPWSLGFGLVMQDLTRLGRSGWPIAVACAGFLSLMMSAAAFEWYHSDRQYIDGHGRPVRRRTQSWRELIVEPPGRSRTTSRAGTYTIPRDVTHVFGGYWDVYRMAFLSGGRIVGIPFPIYPNRFRGWSGGLGPRQGALLVLRPDVDARAGSPQLAGSTTRERKRKPMSVLSEVEWLPPLTTVWKADGRDPAELKNLRVIVPSPEPARR
jgi:hypothetical protein